MLLAILIVKKMLECFMKKKCEKKNHTEFRVEKVINRKGGRLYAKWKGYNHSFISWIDEKDSVNE